MTATYVWASLIQTHNKLMHLKISPICKGNFICTHTIEIRNGLHFVCNTIYVNSYFNDTETCLYFRIHSPEKMEEELNLYKRKCLKDEEIVRHVFISFLHQACVFFHCFVKKVCLCLQWATVVSQTVGDNFFPWICLRKYNIFNSVIFMWILRESERHEEWRTIWAN